MMRLLAILSVFCYSPCMTRLLSIEYAGAVYQATSRGNENKPVFKDDTDRQHFLNTLQRVKSVAIGSVTPLAS